MKGAVVMALRLRASSSLIITALALGTLVIPSAASAAPVSVDEFSAAFSQALEESGLLAHGTTVIERNVEHTMGRWYVNTVNADGSLISTAATPSTLSQVKCVRPDRCWRRAYYKYGDTKWHLVTRGSVKYESLSARLASFTTPFVSTPEMSEWHETFDIDAVSVGAGTFTRNVVSPVGTSVVVATLSGPHLTMIGSVLIDPAYDRNPTQSLIIDAQPEPVPVRAPPRDKIGEPASPNDTGFTVAIN